MMILSMSRPLMFD